MNLPPPLRPTTMALSLLAAIAFAAHAPCTQAALARVAPRQAAGPESPRKRLDELIAALNSAGDDLLQRFVQGALAPVAGAPHLTPAERIGRLRQLRLNHAPLSIVDVLDDTRDHIIAGMRDRNGEPLGIRLDIEHAPPYRVVAIRLGDPDGLRHGPPPHEYTHWHGLRDLVRQIRSDCGSPGMALAIARNGALIDEAVDGVRAIGQPDRVQPGDLWQIGSVTKPMTATMVAVLIDRGVLSWGTTLGDALPGVKMRPGYREVTIEQLMQHRGGVPQDMMFTRDQVNRITAGARTPTQCRAAYVADVLSREPIAKPGERMAYSNAGYTILGYVAERRTGRTYEQLMSELLFRPLGMTSARIGVTGRPDQPQGHVRGPAGLRIENIGGKLPLMTSPGGAVLCSIADLARFALAHADGLKGKNRLLRPETFRRLHALPPSGPGLEPYACGWEQVTDLTPQPFQGHGGSNGTFRAFIGIFPERGEAIAAAVNDGGEEQPQPTQQAIRTIVMRERLDGKATRSDGR